LCRLNFIQEIYDIFLVASHVLGSFKFYFLCFIDLLFGVLILLFSSLLSGSFGSGLCSCGRSATLFKKNDIYLYEIVPFNNKINTSKAKIKRGL
jgi:hypothetical protein